MSLMPVDERARAASFQTEDGNRPATSHRHPAQTRTGFTKRIPGRVHHIRAYRRSTPDGGTRTAQVAARSANQRRQNECAGGGGGLERGSHHGTSHRDPFSQRHRTPPNYSTGTRSVPGPAVGPSPWAGIPRALIVFTPAGASMAPADAGVAYGDASHH
jgi:hypothetical protein